MRHDERLVEAVEDALQACMPYMPWLGESSTEEIALDLLDAINASGTHWIAPWEATEAMRRPRPFPTEWNEYRDAYLAEQAAEEKTDEAR